MENTLNTIEAQIAKYEAKLKANQLAFNKENANFNQLSDQEDEICEIISSLYEIREALMQDNSDADYISLNER